MISTALRPTLIGLAMSVAMATPAATQDWSFEYTITDPSTQEAQRHIVSTRNAELWDEGANIYWKAEVGGRTLETSDPGVVTFRFTFDDPVSRAHLRLNMPTYHWGYSRGHNYLYGSSDGSDWVLLQDVPPPDYGGANGGVYDDDLPQSLLGGNEIWLRAELYCYGDRATEGGVWTNTAQLLRWPTNPEYVTFRLQADIGQTPAGNATVIDFDDLAPSDVVTDQYPEATFSSSSPSIVVVVPTGSSQPNSIGAADRADWLTVNLDPVYVDFTEPVNNLSLTVVDSPRVSPSASTTCPPVRLPIPRWGPTRPATR